MCSGVWARRVVRRAPDQVGTSSVRERQMPPVVQRQVVSLQSNLRETLMTPVTSKLSRVLHVGNLCLPFIVSNPQQ
jgi:hypothetical protein